jgi:hypothetical protein
MLKVMKKTIIISIILLVTLPALAQKKQETGLKREITLYNPYKPSLPDVVKKSFLPDMTDTSKVKPDFRYDVKTFPFMPPYSITSIKPAALLPDPLSKLYKSFVNLGFGNYVTPLAEVSITNERSKKGAIGLYARHFSTNGKVELQNLSKVFAGYMDNDVSLYGRKFLKSSVLSGSLDFMQKTRYAYGYDTSYVGPEPLKKDIRLNYYNLGAKAELASAKIDSSEFAYDFELGYNYFFNYRYFNQHTFEFKGEMAKSFRGFYVGSGLEFGYYKPSDTISEFHKSIFAVSPFIKKSTSQWNVKLGFQALLDKGLFESAKLHLYPDLRFGFSIIPSYLNFFAGLTGEMEKNEPVNVIGVNPYLLRGETLFELRNTDHSLIVKAGFEGETGIEGNYRLSASYSVINDMLLFSNFIMTEGPMVFDSARYFIPLYDDAEILNLHGEMAGKINEKLTFETSANYYRYTFTQKDFEGIKPAWDITLGVKYNLRNKIIAGISMDAAGKRKLPVTIEDPLFLPSSRYMVDLPAHLNFNIGAEYRYTKILSFWLKFNNISFSKYYEWAYYPSQRFMCMVGFTYSL